MPSSSAGQPFGMSSSGPSSLSHLRDKATMAFAQSIMASKNTAATAAAPAHELGDGDVQGDESGSGATPKPGRLAAVTAEDLIKFAQDEGTQVEQLCRKEPCREVVQRLIFNDSFRKMEFSRLSSELFSAQARLEKSAEEETELVARLKDLDSENEALQESLAECTEREQKVSRALDELKKEKASFSDAQNLLQSQLKTWTANLAKAQQAMARAIWKKPGVQDDEEDALSFRSSSQASLQQLSSISRYQEARLAAVMSPARSSYGRLAGGGVLDFSDNLASRLARLKSRRRAGAGSAAGERLESLSCSPTAVVPAASVFSSASAATLPTFFGRGASGHGLGGGRSPPSSAQLALAGVTPLTLLSPVKVHSPFRVGTSSKSLSLEIGRSVREREGWPRGGGGGAEGGGGYGSDDGASEMGSVASAMSALTGSTFAHTLSSSAGGGASLGAHSTSGGGAARPRRVGKVRVQPVATRGRVFAATDPSRETHHGD